MQSNLSRTDTCEIGTLCFVCLKEMSVLQRVNYSKTDTFVTGTMPPSQRDVRLLESHPTGVRQRQRPTPGVNFSKLSAKRGLSGEQFQLIDRSQTSPDPHGGYEVTELKEKSICKPILTLRAL